MPTVMNADRAPDRAHRQDWSNDEPTIASQLADGAPAIGWDLECEEEVCALTRGLGDAGEVLRLILLRAEFGGHQKLAGRHMGISESRTSQLIALAIGRIRERFGVKRADSPRTPFRVHDPEESAARERERERNRRKHRKYDAKRRAAAGV